MARLCRACSKSELSTSKENYLYSECGLPHVVLVGIDVRRCPECGHHEPILPRVTELHRTIALALVRKPSRLVGAEIRYLRKYLGWSGVDLAKRMGVDPATVSNWETDKDPIGAPSDRLVRVLVVIGQQVQDYVVDELANIESKRELPLHLRVSPKGNGWQQLAA